jgi:hypothetical protein
MTCLPVPCGSSLRLFQDAFATHIAVQEELDGVAVVWLEKVTDAEYAVGLPAGTAAHTC